MFDTNLFASPSVLLMGALAGLAFGFLLQKGGVTRYDVIVGQFLLRDFTVLKVMLTAIVTGALGIWGMLALGWLEPTDLHLKAATLLANALGGAVFGVGMAVLGYCPGTAIGATGQGSRDALFGILGMIAGAFAYAAAYPWIRTEILPVADRGKVTIADVAGISPWWLIAALAVGSIVLLSSLERWERTRSNTAV
ncbi:MAG: YeeE/YedE thiosulfate transporter family protein [Acidobacteriota bacterium]